MRDAIRRYVDAAQSLTEIPRERAERIARRLASSGVIDREQIRSVASELVERSRENRRRLTGLVTTELGRQVSRLGLASKEDVERLRQRVQALEVSARRSAAAKVAGKPRAKARAKPAATKKKASSRARRSPSAGR